MVLHFSPISNCISLCRRICHAIPIRRISLGCPLCYGYLLCQKFIDFLTVTLAAQALKPVTLGASPTNKPGGPLHLDNQSREAIGNDEEHINRIAEREGVTKSSNHAPSCSTIGDGDDVPQVQTKEIVDFNPLQGEKDVSEANKGSDERRTEAQEAKVQERGPPKKMVSINENVEEILPSKKRKRKKGGVEKTSSRGGGEHNEEKPLRSILKTTSNIDDKYVNGNI